VELIMGRGQGTDRETSTDAAVIGHFGKWVGRGPNRSGVGWANTDWITAISDRQQRDNVRTPDEIKKTHREIDMFGDGFGELGEKGTRPGGAPLGFYLQLQWSSEEVQQADDHVTNAPSYTQSPVTGIGASAEAGWKQGWHAADGLGPLGLPYGLLGGLMGASGGLLFGAIGAVGMLFTNAAYKAEEAQQVNNVQTNKSYLYGSYFGQSVADIATGTGTTMFGAGTGMMMDPDPTVSKVAGGVLMGIGAALVYIGESYEVDPVTGRRMLRMTDQKAVNGTLALAMAGGTAGVISGAELTVTEAAVAGGVSGAAGAQHNVWLPSQPTPRAGAQRHVTAPQAVAGAAVQQLASRAPGWRE
jgi:hypothetical protein